MSFNLEKINKRFRIAGEKILALRWIFIAVLVILTCVSAVGIQKVSLNSAWDKWFFEDDPIMRAKDRFESIFGNSDDGAILFQADDIFTYDNLRMIRELSKEIEDNVPMVEKVVSLTEFEFSRGTDEGIEIGSLVPDEIPRGGNELERIRRLAFSKKNLVNKLFSDDSRETWIHIRLREVPDEFKEKPENKGKEPLYVIGGEIHKIIHQEKYKKYNLKETGMTAVAFDKSNFFQKESGKIIFAAIIATIIILIVFLRSFRGVIVPLITTLSAIVISYGTMGFIGVSVDASMITVPIYLAMAVSIGYSIHILNFFKRRFIVTGKRRESILYAIEHTGWPLFFTALTTVGCMLSFNLADITSIHWVGNASASMVAVVYIFVMVLTPVFLSFGRDREPGVKDSGAESVPIKSDGFFERLGDGVLRNPVKIIAAGIILIVALGFGMKNVTADFEPFKSFGMKVPYVKRLYDITHSKIGSMYSYNLMIELPENGQAKDPAVLKKFEKLESEIHKLPLTKNSMSILDVIKDMNRTLHGNDETYYRIPERRDLISQLLLLYENSGGEDAEYWMDYDYRILRLQVNINEFKAAEVEREIEILQKLITGLFPGSSPGMVGTFFEGALANNYIARGQVKTFFMALAVIAILMIVVFRSVKAGLIALVPNLIPVIVIGGLMGYFNIPIDMMSMTIVPMLMGIAVDDSIHFINHMKLEVERGAAYDEAVRRTFKTVGRALLMTSLILIVTFGMYCSSVVVFFKNLGVLVALGLVSALLADYLLTPVLISLTRPFGKISESEKAEQATGIIELDGDENIVL